MNEDELNQTQFVEDLPLKTQNGNAQPSVVSPDVDQEEPVPIKKKRNPLLIAALALGGILVISLFASLLLTRKTAQQTGSSPQTQASASPVDTTVHPLQQDITDLDAAVQAADPDKTDVPFPPVSMELRLRDASTIKN